MLMSAKRPMLLIGGGVRLAGACDLLDEFLDKTNIPVVTSLMGIDAVSHEYDGYIGMIGSYGIRRANILLSHADCVLVL